ncbi:phosphatidylinositol-glycan biosynthesis class S protein-domain-containing protein [Thelephora terrestris]|uniref:Phosphatidylinositol-glycan biosynthesis class S protein-domain-containing protein n=1 Tax=Thelephora terrestris TaxID=56493 RepID=A0A9P6HJD0_9AGAM|nr:phosphatidylinositol-glycan biosynthesis class S protein-domain-containing protein [Thelephora terrestris]
MSGDADDERIFLQSRKVRWSILAAYWAVILLALPLWWTTTSIQRLSLPTSRVEDLSREDLRFPVDITLNPSTGVDVNALSVKLRGLINARLGPDVRSWLNVNVHPNPVPGTDSYVLDFDAGSQDSTVKERNLTLAGDGSSPSKAANLLIDLLTPRHTAANQQKIAKYSPRYRLAFSLLNENAALGKSALGWDLNDALSRYLFPTLQSLQLLHNFTIESQVQFHAPLAFDPTHLNDSAHGLTHEDLTVFVNSAEWSLSSSASNDPVLHFVLFVPSIPHRPLYLLDSEGTPMKSNAFILPQWGGIVIHNFSPDMTSNLHMTPEHLEGIFSAFRLQLFTLLGVPELPKGVLCLDDALPSRWQMDSLLRQRSLENVASTTETLHSIIKLVNQIENMPVKEDVKGDIQNALDTLELTYKSSNSAKSALEYSARALTLSSRAFFNPGMLALLYFPPEHTYAIYAPLFAPVSLPLLAPVVREFIAWRKAKRAKQKVE